MSSTEKLNANAKAMASQRLPLFLMETIIMTKQNALATTVNAFFSDKYFFMLAELKDALDFKSLKFISKYLVHPIEVGQQAHFFD
jgi:hypothetical protein